MQQSAATSGRVRLFGQAQSAEAYQIRDLLTRSVVGFDWVELTCDEDCGRELGLPDLANVRLPVVELPDGRELRLTAEAAAGRRNKIVTVLAEPAAPPAPTAPADGPEDRAR